MQRGDGDNPFRPPGSADPVPQTDYSAFNNREASQFGFSLLGSFFDAKSKLYRIRYDFWLSGDRVVLAVIGGGTLASIPLDATWLITRTGDRGCLFTVDEPKAADSDPSGLTHQEIRTNADFPELLTRHLERSRCRRPSRRPLFADGRASKSIVNFDKRGPIASRRADWPVFLTRSGTDGSTTFRERSMSPPCRR